jgi:hypothetical protein
MAEDDTDRTRPPLPGMPEIDRELERLRERLGALHESVDDLGRRPPPEPAPSPTVAIPAGAGAHPPPGPPSASRSSERTDSSTPTGAPVFAPPPATPPPPPPRPGPPPATPLARSGTPAPPAIPASGPSAGHPPPVPPAPAPPAPAGSPVSQPGQEGPADASFVVVDAGPIAGLAAARRFEDALAALPAVREVRLRRFARRRAELEVGLSEPHALGPELPMLELPARIETFKRDRLVLHVGEGTQSP